MISHSFLYGGNATFLTLAFPAEHFGKLFGLVMTLSAIVSLLQSPIFTLFRGPLQNNPFYVSTGGAGGRDLQLRGSPAEGTPKHGSVLTTAQLCWPHLRKGQQSVEQELKSVIRREKKD